MADSLGDTIGDPADSETGDQDLARFIKQFNESADATRDARRAAEIYRDYYDGKQWSSDEEEKLRARGQPCITDNRIKDKIEYLLGMERQTRTDPKAYPRTPKDDPGADAATDALRYVADCNHFPQVKSSVFENMTVEGFGGCEVIVEDDKSYQSRGGKGNKKVIQRYIRWDRLYYDAHSLLRDFSDARYMGIVKWMDVNEAKSSYPAFSDFFEAGTSVLGLPWGTTTYDDRPRWFDRQRKRVQILEHYYKDGDEWRRAVFSRAGFIESPAKSPYTDCETKKTECPLKLQSLYVDREGNRYGVVKRYKDLQDEINKRRSKSLHLLSVNQIVAEKGAVDDIALARKEAARPDGVIEYTPSMKLELKNNADLAEGQFKLLQEAQLALSATGPNQALLGHSGEISGKAKQIDATGGAIQLGILSDSLRYWQVRVMRSTWSRIKQYWDSEQWIRVTDDDKTKFMALNSKYPDDHKMVMSGKVNPGEPMNDVAQMDVDIIIDEMPDVITVQQEQFQTLAELAKSGLPIPPDALIEASSLRSGIKTKILDAMGGGDQEIPPAIQQQIKAKEEQITQITQAQQEKAQQQQAKEQELAAGHAQAQVEQANIKTAQAQLDAKTAKFQAQEAQAEAARQQAGAQANIDRLEALLKAADVTQAHADLVKTEAQTEKILEETRILTELPQAQDKGTV